MSVPLTKVDSAIAGLSISDEKPGIEKEVKAKTHRRASSTVEGVWNIKDLGKDIINLSGGNDTDGTAEEQKMDIELPIETQKTGWSVSHLNASHIHQSHWPRPRKLNTSPSTIEDKDILKMFLVTPPVKKIDLHFPLGLEVTARNLKGVTIKDALDAIYKQFKKKVSGSTV